jgi:NADPH-dependent 2,4-dienoyl-CoA reductase/sulfur reductase-like enzyme
MLHLRDTSDARALRSALASRPRLAVVGAGFIGLEVAAVATQMGAPVTVIEAAATPLATVLGTELGGWLQAWHEDRGIAFRCSTVVTGTTAQARGRRLALSDGTSLVADVVVLGVGVSPNVGWLDRSGVEVHVGVVCDEHGRTTHPHVLAVGDVTCRHVGGRCLPSGHWTAASEQAFGVAATLLGNGAPPMPPPQEGYFWSDQFDARFQFAGAFEPGASFTLTAGSLEDTEFVGTLAAQHGLCAAFAMNSPRGFTRAVRDLGRTLRPTPT